ncbi:cation:dicarboxylate symporter family transporter [Acetivibrio ethanolgignens]|uniref:L-cystine uptake protein TcyP n=1 Tax=Acetivibrio ethanolgignens TaxID=290052 RepID=A0A0V8QCB3_9FIRM|nr:cation:dicarboxylase symporter family transporter [Acetivibrio ethanolgignens]KSV57878.1 sodium:dicarboxylate symporter [Acetivibrio ethanolgignens]
MQNVFFQEFLMISDVRTIAFLVVLAGLFYLIHVLYHKKHMDFAVVVMIGTGLGLVLGLTIQLVAGFPDAPMEVSFVKETTTWFAMVGSGYINLIKMIVVPLVMISIMQVIINMQQGNTMGKLVKKTIFVTMGMVAVAAVIGVVIGLLFGVGKGAALVEDGTATANAITPVATTIKNLIPGNIVGAMVDSNIIGLVIFSAFLGLAIWWINQESAEAAKPLYDIINAAHKAMINMALLILDYMPWAVMALLANTIAQRGLSSILEVGKFIIALYVAAAVQFIIQLGLLAANGLNPVVYLKKAYPTMLMAFTSRSSVGCLPMTIETLTKKLGVDQGTASFVAGFGTTAGMQGCAGIFPSLLIIYVCNITGTPIDVTMIVMTIFVVTIGSLGIAGIPGTATMAASVGLSGVGMGAHFAMVSPILAIDPIIDMPRTMLNVTGSLTNAIIVDKSMGHLNEENYNDMRMNKL